jgi:hypothetical protein
VLALVCVTEALDALKGLCASEREGTNNFHYCNYS